jgi:twitching motility protein PilT
MDPDKTRKLNEMIAAGGTQYGMQTFDQSLMSLYTRGLITYEEALHWCSNPDDFALRVRGVTSTADATWQGVSDDVPKGFPGMQRL